MQSPTTFEAVGRWWIAGAPQQPVSGRLTSVKRLGVGARWEIQVYGRLGEFSDHGMVEGVMVQGATDVGKLTLSHASLSRESMMDDVTIQYWEGHQLLRGEWIETSEIRFERMSFRLPWLEKWFGPTDLNRLASRASDALKVESDPKWDVALGDIALVMGMGSTSSIGRFIENRESYGYYVLTKGDGLTLEEAEHMQSSFARLHSILIGRTLRPFDIHLWPSIDRLESSLTEIDDAAAHSMLESKSAPLDVFVDTSEVDVDSFIRNWIDLDREARFATAVAGEHDSTSPIEVRILQIVSALERLGRVILPNPEPSDGDIKLLGLAKSLGMNSSQRSRLRTFLQMQRATLRSRLVSIAATIGPQSARWMLGDDLEDWATLVAKQRNAYAHGLRLPESLTDNGGLGMGTILTGEAVLRLALLKHVGYHNPLHPSEGELVYADGRPASPHLNSRLYRSATNAAFFRDQWAQWRSELPD